MFYIDIENILQMVYCDNKISHDQTLYCDTRRLIIIVKCYIVTTEFYIVTGKEDVTLWHQKELIFFNIERLHCDRFVLCFYCEMIQCYVVTNNIGSLLEAYIVFSKDFKLKMKKLYWKRQWQNPLLCGYIF